jgi:hypothetical protein
MKVPFRPQVCRRFCGHRGLSIIVSRRGPVISAVAALVLGLGTKCSVAGPWNFTEFFSNADGSVQFIEVTCTNVNNQQDIATGTITSLITGKVYTIPAALPSSATANRSFLVATDNFESLAGAILPDYATFPGLPANFFDPNGDSITISHITHGIMDQRAFFTVPTDGVHSLDLKANAVGINTPTNFAGQVGSVNLTQLTGDYNSNGAVDAADYVVWRQNLGTTNMIPNDSSPESISPEDYNVWRQRFGGSAAGGTSSAAVPEPTIIGTIVLVVLPLHAFRMRRTVK